MLLPCRTKLQFGSTVARQEIYSDSDVVPESNQIQGLLIDHFTVVYSVTWPLNGSEAGGDLALIQTSLVLSCKIT